MAVTNELFFITNTAKSEIGYLFLGFAIIIVFYSIVSVEYKRRKMDKLEEAARLIEEGHNRIVVARKKGDLK